MKNNRNMKLIPISLAAVLLFGAASVKVHAEEGTNYYGVPYTVENGILTLGEEGTTYTLNSTYEDAPWNTDETITEVRILGEILVATTDGMFTDPDMIVTDPEGIETLPAEPAPISEGDPADPTPEPTTVPVTYAIDASAVNGTITQSDYNIPEGGTREFTFSPNAGYFFDKVLIDGNELDPGQIRSSYTFENITSGHSIRAEFVSADNSLSLSQTPDNPNYVETVVYTLTVQNPFSNPVSFTLTDTLPKGLTCTGVEECSVNGQTLTWNMTLNAGESRTFTVKANVTAAQAGTSLTSVVRLSSPAYGTVSSKKIKTSIRGIRGWYHNTDEDYWYYLDNNGSMKKGWIRDGDVWYFADNNTGHRIHGWFKTTGLWYYFGEDGIMRTGFTEVDGVTYYMHASGYMMKGWRRIDNNWYYFNNDGSMQKGWKYIRNGWYYMNENGVMMTGFINDGQADYYLNSSGVMLTDWRKINNSWYYFNKNGTMQKGWKYIRNAWYYMNEKGVMLTGWQFLDGKWYYMNSNGAMLANKWVGDYYLKSDGSMAVNEVIDNAWFVDENGKWITRSYSLPYYNQSDSRWSGTKYGSYTLGQTGCAESAIASAISGILGQEILPTDVADYLYETGEFNSGSLYGSTALCKKYAAEKYGIKYKGISSYGELDAALRSGFVVVGAVGYGTFCPSSGVTHEIVMTGYSNGTTNVNVSSFPNVNGWHGLDKIWGQQSKDPVDSKGGYNFYAYWN